MKETEEAQPKERNRDKQGRFAKGEEEYSYRSEREIKVVKRRGTYGTYDVKDYEPYSTVDLLICTAVAFTAVAILMI
ncbi:hypothetical protein NCCP28_34160 [Niallia sp. NCCP-28]|nr:hypothetical protein NCCP28_34160 [Niallia sp. NCCP-28]